MVSWNVFSQIKFDQWFGLFLDSLSQLGRIGSAYVQFDLKLKSCKELGWGISRLTNLTVFNNIAKEFPVTTPKHCFLFFIYF
jgi:hypothetical protein